MHMHGITSRALRCAEHLLGSCSCRWALPGLSGLGMAWKLGPHIKTTTCALP